MYERCQVRPYFLRKRQLTWFLKEWLSVHEVIGLFSLVINKNSLENTQVTSEAQTVVEHRQVGICSITECLESHKLSQNGTQLW